MAPIVKDSFERNAKSSYSKLHWNSEPNFSTATNPAMLAVERPCEYQANDIKLLENKALPLSFINSPKNDSICDRLNTIAFLGISPASYLQSLFRPNTPHLRSGDQIHCTGTSFSQVKNLPKRNENDGEFSQPVCGKLARKKWE